MLEPELNQSRCAAGNHVMEFTPRAFPVDAQFLRPVGNLIRIALHFIQKDPGKRFVSQFSIFFSTDHARRKGRLDYVREVTNVKAIETFGDSLSVLCYKECWMTRKAQRRTSVTHVQTL